MMMIDNYVGEKLKRKDLEEVNDDFSEFSLSSPARKIRRLDVELPPIIEEEEEGVPLQYSYDVPSNGMREQLKPLEIDELLYFPGNDEKAVVPFTSTNEWFFNSDSNFSVDPHLIACFRNQALLGAHLNTFRHHEEDESKRNGDNKQVNSCRAVIPWVSSHHSDQTVSVISSEAYVSESVDPEETVDDAMEIEGDDGAPNVRQQVSAFTCHPTMSEDLILQQHQWLHQHCVIPPPPQNVTNPIASANVTKMLTW